MNISKKRVLVTGADGFIGSHLTELLVAKGCKVRALVQYNSFNYWGWLEDIVKQNEAEVVCGDIRDSNYCKRITKNIDAVFHLAALIGIPYSYIAVNSYVDTNIRGTLNMCQAVMENGCELFLQTSTSEVYGTAQYVPIDEKHPKQPQSPYSASKIAADMMAMSFYHTFKLPIIIARPFNTYGPRQSARAFIPAIIAQIYSGAKEIRVGDLRPTRDFTFVKDTCMGFLALSECDQAVGQEVNIGSNYEISMKDTLDMVKNLMEADHLTVLVDKIRIRPDKSEVLRLWCDNTKIKQLTGFEPQYGLEKGLKETIKWFTRKNNLKKYKPDLYNI